jgi:transmembrane sensor
MDVQPSYNNLPWEIILSALQGSLSPEEDLEFRKWLDSSAENRQNYEYLQRAWKDRLADYIPYAAADEGKAWEALQQTISQRSAARAPVERKLPMISRWAAAAAVILLATGAGWWYLSRKNAPTLYETAREQKLISLPDGSTVDINPQTRIRVALEFNKADRTVVLEAGEAHFAVAHQAERPFVVDVDAVSVADIGTDFTVQKTKDSIKVTVTGGKVAFIKKETGETRELSAGSSLTYFIAENRFGDVKTATDTGMNGASNLRFDNAPLSEVISALQKASGKPITLDDPSTGQKRLTVHLEGESFDNALKIICASLNLEYTENKGSYVLRNKDKMIHSH